MTTTTTVRAPATTTPAVPTVGATPFIFHLREGIAPFALKVRTGDPTEVLAPDVLEGVHRLVDQLDDHLPLGRRHHFWQGVVDLHASLDAGAPTDGQERLARLLEELVAEALPTDVCAHAIAASLASFGAAEQSLESLVAYYAAQVSADLALDEALQAKMVAALHGGTVLVTRAHVELYDIISNRMVRVPPGTRLVIAEHEGDVTIGQLADSTHSVGVIFEEGHRWRVRKYFLPLSAYVNAEVLELPPPEVAASAPDMTAVMGVGETGTDARTTVAVQTMEALRERDQEALLARGTQIRLSAPCTGETDAGEKMALAAGTIVTVLDAVMSDDATILVSAGEKPVRLSLAVLADIDPDTGIISLEEQYAAAAAIDRRAALARLWGGVGVAVGVGTGIFAWSRSLDQARSSGSAHRALPFDGSTDTPQALARERDRARLFAALYSEAAALFGFFTANEQYWYSVYGAMMDLRQQGAQQVMAALAKVAAAIAAESRQLYKVWKQAFYNTVHTGNMEIKHYRTDEKGNRHYTHSTYVPIYTSVWTEPPGLEGVHAELETWQNQDAALAKDTKYLAQHGLFDLLNADANDPEKSFALRKHTLGVGRDAAIAAAVMGLMTTPAAFYDELIGRAYHGGWRGPVRTAVARRHGVAQWQKEALLAAGMATGAWLSSESQRKTAHALAENKHALGATIEQQIRRVPTLDFATVWDEFFHCPLPASYAEQLRQRQGGLEALVPRMRDFTYVHGSGWDNGRPLMPYHVEAGPARDFVVDRAPRWPTHGERLIAWDDTTGHRDAALPVLRNGLGTRIIETQVAEDKGEASAGSWKRSFAFTAPIWGAVLIDGFTKWLGR